MKGTPMQIPVDLSQTQTAVENVKEMLGVSKMSDGRTLFRVNSSSLDIMKECWRKAGLALAAGYRNNLEGNATLYGTAIHAALQVFYSGDFEKRSLPKDFKAQMDIIASGVPPKGIGDEALVYAAAVAFVESCLPWNRLPREDKHSISSGIYVLEHYFKKYVNDPFQVYADEQGPFVERKFSCRVYEDDNIVIEIFGTIDVVLKHNVTGRLLICDHKTTSSAGPDFFTRCCPNDQYTFYTLGARRVFGIDSNTFLVNGVEKKNRPVKEPHEKGSRATPPNFPRQETRRTDEDFDRLIRELAYYCNEYLRIEKMCGGDPLHWPAGPVNACAMWGGCTYHEVCSMPRSVQETVLGASFRRVGDAATDEEIQQSIQQTGEF